MKLPAQALALLYPQDIAAGRLFRLRDAWALRVSHPEFEGYVSLEGERSGWIARLATGMPKAVSIVEPFGWFPAMALDAKPISGSDQAATLTLTATGPVLIGLDTRDRWDSTYLAITPDGRAAAMHDLHIAPQYEVWSVELCHIDRPFRSLGTLLDVDRRKQT